MTFKELNLIEPIMHAVAEKGYVTPTPIQEQAIPPALEGRDLMGCAQTGTGKTAAFTLPILQLLSARPRTKGRRPIKALVLTPTRELAIQIDECCRDYARYTDLRHCVIFGGVNQRPQVDALQRGIDLLVATPGRLLDLIGQGYVSLSDIRFFVLDEADRFAGDVIDLPASLCARVRFRGHHAESPAQYRRLMQFIREEGYTAAGFSREITVIDYGFTPDTEKFVTEIMIPLQKV